MNMSYILLSVKQMLKMEAPLGLLDGYKTKFKSQVE